MARRALIAIVAAVGGIGLAGAGAGFLNGDAAVYAAQGWAGDPWERPVHVGYVAIAVWLAPIVGPDLPWSLDAVSVVAVALTVALVGRWGVVAAAVCAAVLLRGASFAEVDPVWLALVVAAAFSRGRAAAAGWTCLAVWVSPVALLALPWVAWARTGGGEWPTGPSAREVGRASVPLWIGAVIAVVVVSVATEGWWSGHRGVLSGPPMRPWRTLVGAVAHGLPVAALPLVILGRPSAVSVVLLAPLLLAPPDVAVSGVLAVACAGWAARGASRLSARWVVVLLSIQAVLGVAAWAVRREQVAREERLLVHTVASMAPDDVLVAPWTWGARASVLATRDPYALAWRVPGPPVRDQARLCGRHPRRVWTLPPDLEVRWSTLPGCALPAEATP